MNKIKRSGSLVTLCALILGVSVNLLPTTIDWPSSGTSQAVTAGAPEPGIDWP